MTRGRRERFVTIMATIFVLGFVIGLAGLLGFIPELGAREPGQPSAALIATGASAAGLLLLWLREKGLPKHPDGSRKLDL